MVKNIYRVERCRYPDLETQLIEDFEIKSTFLQEDPDNKILEFKEEIHWVFKYLKLIQFIEMVRMG
jgi:hypothetical protein